MFCFKIIEMYMFYYCYYYFLFIIDLLMKLLDSIEALAPLPCKNILDLLPYKKFYKFTDVYVFFWNDLFCLEFPGF